MRIRTNILIVPLLILILFKTEFQAFVVRMAQTHQVVQVPDEHLTITLRDTTVVYKGGISPGNATALDVFLIINPQATVISMHSGGGNVAAIDMYLDIVAKHNLKVIVEAGNKCMSACAAIAIAQYKSNNLYIEDTGILGFHKIKTLADFRTFTPDQIMKHQELTIAKFYDDLTSYGFSVQMVSKIIQETDEYTLLYPLTYKDLPKFLEGTIYSSTKTK